ncbi:MAG: hypothetical protein ACI9XB_002906 [Gammaproteobacteria bacterium]|jgi:hypothetical protein
MKKYLLTGFYLLVMLAIYHHPIVLPNEGTSIPTGKEQRIVPNNEPDAGSEIYALETIIQKSAFPKKGGKQSLQGLISQNE